MATLSEIFTNIANAVRAKGITGTMTPAEMPTKISEIVTGDDAAAMRLIISRDSDALEDGAYNDDQITLIGWCGLAGYPSLTSVNIPACTLIGQQGFYSSQNLTTVSAPAVQNVNAAAFSGCTKLATVDVSGVTGYIGNSAFNGCSALTTINIPLATQLYPYAFQNCTSLTTVNAPKVTSVGNYSFYGCSVLNTVDLSEAITIGSDAFEQCYRLTSLTLPKVTTIGGAAFSECSGLTSLTLPKVTIINYGVLQYCSSLAELDLGESCTSINNYAFGYGKLSNLNKITLRSTTKVTYGQTGTSYLPGTTGTLRIYVPADLLSTYQSSSGDAWAKLYAADNNVFQAIS